MGPPDEQGRKAIFLHHMEGLKLAADVDRAGLAADLAVATTGFTGADIAYSCQRAALLCVKEASTVPRQRTDLAITAEHFRSAIANQGRAASGGHRTGVAETSTRLLAQALN